METMENNGNNGKQWKQWKTMENNGTLISTIKNYLTSHHILRSFMVTVIGIISIFGYKQMNQISSPIKSQPTSLRNSKIIFQKSTLNHHLTDVNITLEGKYNISVNGSYMFPYIINNPALCSATEKIHHIIIVVSAPSHGRRRNYLRQTWAKQHLLRSYPSRTIYVMGNTYSGATQANIQEENNLHHDIVQADFEDSYHNLTFSVLVGIKWVLTYCNQTAYVIKANDDTFADVFTLMDVLEKYIPARSIGGRLRQTTSLNRDNGINKCGKWCVAMANYPHLMRWPDYVLGELFILNGDILRSLYQTAVQIPYLWIEDVYLTGICLKRIRNTKLVNLVRYYVYYDMERFLAQYKHVNSTSTRKTYFCSVVSRFDSFLKAWNIVLNQLDEEGKAKFGLSTNKNEQIA